MTDFNYIHIENILFTAGKYKWIFPHFLYFSDSFDDYC